MILPRSERSKTRWRISLALFLFTLFLICFTTKDYGVTWDEPAYFTATDLHTDWLIRLVQSSGPEEWAETLNDKTIQAAWHWNPYHVPHPPFSRIVSGLLKSAAPPVLDEISVYRIAPALFFALLVTLMFIWISQLFGMAAGLFSAFTVVLIPNLFGYAHLAVTDLPLATMWFATVYCFYKGLSDWRWSVALGIVWGLAISTKFPALLAFVPLAFWGHVFYREKYVNNLFAMLFLAPVVMIATQPYLWHHTGIRVLEFLYEGISRGYRVETNFAVFFDHKAMPSHELPWYYPFLMVGVTTPEPVLALALLGSCLGWRQEHRAMVALFLGNAIFILLLGVMPGAVLHDGVRQMLAALPFLSALAGVGFNTLATWLHSFAKDRLFSLRIEKSTVKINTALFLLISVPPTLDLCLTHPYQLSFYNRFVGGIRGAYERGFETTYFLEALTPKFLQELNDKLPDRATVNASFANSILQYYQDRRLLREDLQITSKPPYDYLLLVNRRSALSPRERDLMNDVSLPEISVRLAGIPLVSVFNLKKFRDH